VKGVVLKSTGSWYQVRDLENRELFDCRIKGKFRVAGIKSTNPLAVGDFVEFELEEKDERQGIIQAIEDRKNYIVRKSVNLSKRVHIIASNMDQALLVTTLAQPMTSTGFMDRFLATAEAYSIPTVIVFNKIDVYGEEELMELEYREAVYSAIGYKVLKTSATEGQGTRGIERNSKRKDHLAQRA
jgi:ribosome biogenesis GTPase